METEVKLYTPDHQVVRARLEALGASLSVPRVLERNWRYDTPQRSLSSTDQVLRLRQDSAVRLTYKGHSNAVNGILSRPEYEVSLDDFETMDAILRALGYAPYMIYEKYRTTYQLGAVEVVLDELPYGCFTEIEGEAQAIEQAIVQLGLSAAPRLPASYAVLFERVKRRLGLSFSDLTFANFAGLSVPPEAFLA
ncbi:MAG: class IV adenylate cyclase [Anaerolineae bacterium]|nr:class IV adenylate cyclase [Anaerolineae bacterium]MDW8171132.1 class IV adenylate cyclase [Anaerolineae bacterium]